MKTKKEKIISMFVGGKSVVDIALELNTTKMYCYKILNNAGISIRKDINENQIINMYKNGMSLGEIHRQKGVWYRSIVKILKKHGIKPRTLKEACKVNEKEQKDIDDIVKRYLSGDSVKKISKDTGIGRSTCNKYLRRRNVKIRSWDNRKWKVNDNYFERINCEEKAYWLGFILADGCITGRDNCLILGLAEKDRGHIEKMVKCMDATFPIKTKPSGGYSKKSKISFVNISSKKIKSDLMTIGIGPKKTFSVKPLDFCNIDIDRHFWRGVVDGDGWVCNYENINIVGLCGNYFVVDGFSRFINKATNIKYQSPKKHKTIWKVVYYGKKNPKAICDLLYNKSNIYLDRKQKTAKKIIGEKNK